MRLNRKHMRKKDTGRTGTKTAAENGYGKTETEKNAAEKLIRKYRDRKDSWEKLIWKNRNK